VVDLFRRSGEREHGRRRERAEFTSILRVLSTGGQKYEEESEDGDNDVGTSHGSVKNERRRRKERSEGDG